MSPRDPSNPAFLKVLGETDLAAAVRKKDKSAPKSIDTLYKKAANAVTSGNPAVAIPHLIALLHQDPAQVPARTQLGQLRFSAPPQPLLNELRQRYPLDVCEVTIEVRNPCNYRCHYCVAAGHNDDPVLPFDLDAIARSLEAITAELVVTAFDCGGGEPTIHPQFADLVRLCAARGPVSFPTNNSQNPERWLPRDTADRIYVRAAIHTEAEAHLEKYARHARYLIEAGSTFTSVFIAHPTRIPKIPEYRQFFADLGVPFTPVSFIGEYEGRRYPHAYSDDEKRLLGLLDENRNWAHKIEPQVQRIRNFRGISCLAGFRNLVITARGAVHRCTYDKRPLDRPLEKPEACLVKYCGCGLFLEQLNVVESIDYYNHWAPMAGLPTRDVSWMGGRAAELGYASAQEAFATEHGAMYDELMRAYGKDEIPE